MASMSQSIDGAGGERCAKYDRQADSCGMIIISIFPRACSKAKPRRPSFLPVTARNARIPPSSVNLGSQPQLLAEVVVVGNDRGSGRGVCIHLPGDVPPWPLVILSYLYSQGVTARCLLQQVPHSLVYHLIFIFISAAQLSDGAVCHSRVLASCWLILLQCRVPT